MTENVFHKIRTETMKPGNVSESMYHTLIDISAIRSEKVINALRDFFVDGKSRLDVCIEYNVNAGYLSIKIKELQVLMRKILNLYLHYNEQMITEKKAQV